MLHKIRWFLLDFTRNSLKTNPSSKGSPVHLMRYRRCLWILTPCGHTIMYFRCSPLTSKEVMRCGRPSAWGIITYPCEGTIKNKPRTNPVFVTYTVTYICTFNYSFRWLRRRRYSPFLMKHKDQLTLISQCYNCWGSGGAMKKLVPIGLPCVPHMVTV